MPRDVRVVVGGMTGDFPGPGVAAVPKHPDFGFVGSRSQWGSERETHSWTRNRVSTAGVQISRR